MKAETKTVEEVTEVLIDYRGKTPPKSEAGIQLITAKVIKNGFIRGGHNEYLSEEVYDNWMTRGLPRQGDVLITTEAPLGEVAQIRTADRIALAQRVILLRGDPEVIDQQYLLYSLQSPIVQHQLQARSTGTTVKGIKQSELRQVEIPIPTAPVQERIGSILTAYDDLIVNSGRRTEVLEAAARAIYREWFVEFRFPGHQDIEMAASELGAIPRGWEVQPFDKAAKLVRDSIRPTNYPDERFDYYSFSAFDKGRRPEEESGSEIKSNKYLVHEGCVLLAKLNPRIPRVWRPPIAGTRRPITSTEFLVLIPQRPFSRAYLFEVCRSTKFLGRLRSLAGGTSTSHQRVKTKDLLQLPVVIPPKSLVDRFTQITSSIHDLVDILRENEETLRSARDMLLPRLVSGEIDVSDLDIDMSRLPAWQST